MTLLETMQERIRTAVPTQEPPIEQPPGKDWVAVNRKLASLNRRAELPQWASVEDVFPGDDVEDDRDFIFTKIRGLKDASPLMEAMAADAEPTETWPFTDWLKRGLADRKTVIAVQREGEPGFAGFAVVSTRLLVNDFDLDEDMDPAILLTVDLAAVYILPQCRRKGFSQALSWAAGQYVDSVVDHVSDMSPKDYKPIEGLEFEVFIRGEAHSAGGARFLSNTVDEIRTNVEMNMFVEGKLMPAVTDDVDFSDFPDCGFGEEEAELPTSPGAGR